MHRVQNNNKKRQGDTCNWERQAGVQTWSNLFSSTLLLRRTHTHTQIARPRGFFFLLSYIVPSCYFRHNEHVYRGVDHVTVVRDFVDKLVDAPAQGHVARHVHLEYSTCAHGERKMKRYWDFRWSERVRHYRDTRGRNNEKGMKVCARKMDWESLVWVPFCSKTGSLCRVFLFRFRLGSH